MAAIVLEEALRGCLFLEKVRHAAAVAQYSSALFRPNIRSLFAGPELRYAVRLLAVNEKSGVGARSAKRSSMHDDFTGAGGRCLGRISPLVYAPPVPIFAGARRDRAVGRAHRARMHWKQRRSLPQCRAHAAGDACGTRH